MPNPAHPPNRHAKRYNRDRWVSIGLGLLARLPLVVNHGLGATLGWIFWLARGRMRRISEINLALCYPEQSRKWRRAVVRRSLIELGKALTEAPWLWRAGPDRLRALATSTNQLNLDAPRQPGAALFLISPHLGSWEFAGLHAATYGPMTSLYSPIAHPEIDRWVRSARASTGAQLAAANREGLRQIQAARDRGEMIGLLPDQSPRRATGTYAPFFGHLTLTMTLLPRLIDGRHDRILFAFAERLPWGRGYRYHMIEAGPEVGDNDRDKAAAEVNRLVEALVRQCPEQYNWAYKRFRPPPPGQPDPYRQ